MTEDPVDPNSAQVEHQFHQYVGNDIPWFVRLIWVGFWAFAVYYTLRWLIPDIPHSLGLKP